MKNKPLGLTTIKGVKPATCKFERKSQDDPLEIKEVGNLIPETQITHSCEEGAAQPQESCP